MKPKKLTNIFNDFFVNTTILVIPKIVATSTRNPFKVIYFLGCILSVILFGRVVFNSLQKFLRYEVDTIVSDVDILSEIDFPVVTICILQICGFKDYDFNKYLEIYKRNEQIKFDASKDEEIEEKLRKNRTKTSYFLAREVFLREYDDSELVKILTRNKTNISGTEYQKLIRCTMGDSECNVEDFQYFSIGEFQKCYKFNSGLYFNGSDRPINKVNTFGENSGFHLEMYIGSEEECKSPLSTSSGLSVYVHNHTYTLTEEDNAILTQPGTKTNIGIGTTYVKQLPSPYGNCLENINNDILKRYKLVNSTVALSKIYTQQYCLQLCFQEFLIKYCECYDQTLPNFSPPNMEVCPKFIDSIYNCVYLIKRLFYNGENDDHCEDDCPRECDYTTYDSTVYSTQFPSSGYYELLQSRLDDSKVYRNKSMVEIKVFYKSSTINKIEEQPSLPFSIFVSELGGALGLFLGCSILSFIEIIEIFLSIILIKNKNK